MFINTLPLRVQLDGMSVAELLAQTQAQLVELLQYEHASLAQAQRYSGMRGGMPLFSAVLNYRHNAAPSNEADGGQISVLGGYERTNYPFTVAVDDDGEGLGITAQLDRRVSAQRVVEYMEQALAELARSVEQEGMGLALDVTIMPEQERRQQLEEFNATVAPYPADVLLQELIEAQVARTPQAVAVQCGAELLTYAELNARANQLAHYLRERGVGPDCMVALCVERGVSMLVATLGILKAGGAYLPLDPSYPPERLAFMLQDSAASVAVTQADFSHLSRAAVTVELDTHWPEIARYPQTNPTRSAVGLQGHHLAYVIYTSGSTGQPKGVLVEHGNLANFLQSMQREPGLSASDRLLAVTTLSFDIAGLELYLPLICGAQVVVASRAATADAAQLLQLIQQHDITVLQATPATYRLLLNAGWLGTAQLTALCGGEALPGELARKLKPRVKQLWNMYGPTETTIWSSSHAVDVEDAVVPIGKPIANTQIYVLDPRRQPVPVGVSGELFIAGAGVARGYWNRPELNAERFTTNPFSDQPGARLYKTGDTGRYRPDGTLEYLGRNDTQVKVRGFRIELGEVEAQLAKHAAIDQVVVVALPDSSGELRLVGYVTPAGAPDNEALRTFLKTRLPDYMVPGAYVRLDNMPLTANGKVDRKALPAPNLAGVLASYTKPHTELEQELCEIWRGVLDVERVGVNDNFFDLGGHSLLAVQLLTQLQERLSVSLPMRALFESPTVADLAGRIDAIRQLEGLANAARPQAAGQAAGQAVEEGWL
jgi:amino acid adenylation domain-containing protein